MLVTTAGPQTSKGMARPWGRRGAAGEQQMPWCPVHSLAVISKHQRPLPLNPAVLYLRAFHVPEAALKQEGSTNNHLNSLTLGWDESGTSVSQSCWTGLSSGAPRYLT